VCPSLIHSAVTAKAPFQPRSRAMTGFGETRVDLVLTDQH